MHIAIAGNIGSGKTTLANRLAKHLNWRAEYEDPSLNPYITDFYQDMQRWALNLQVFFLNARVRSVISIQASGENTVQDRTLYEDAEIFAPNLLDMKLLDERDYATYRDLYETVIALVQPPDLLIYLHGPIANLVDQIAARNREFEDSIRIDYLKRLNERYEQWYERYNRGPKLRFDISELNFKDNSEHLGVILQGVRGELFGLFGEGE